MFAISGFSQTIYLSTLDDELFRLNMSNCNYEFVVQVQTEITDISFHPNGNLYGLHPNGDFYEIDTLTGGINVVHSFSFSQYYNSLTIANNGIIYTSGTNGQLLSYRISTGQEIDHGNMGFNASGDFTFYNGDLYAAVEGNNIIKVDINTPLNSSIVISGNGKNGIEVFGIVTYMDDCRNVKTYAITSSYSKIYEIDFENKRLRRECSIALQVGGGASTTEFMGASADIHIQDIEIQDPTCITDDGVIQVFATADTGVLSYSIDDINFQSSSIFDSLGVGEYTVVINNDIGCPIFKKFVLYDGNDTRIVALRERATDCSHNSGSVTVSGGGGTGQFTYAIDDGEFQRHNTFPDLAYGMYRLTAMDGNGCTSDTIASIIQGDCPVYIPNAFSPNDDGINDLFQVYPHNGFLGRFTSFKIFDRWGNLLYEVGDFDYYNTGWDGSFKGKRLNPGVFVYVVEFEQEDGEKQLLKGNVTLMN